jgi:penicillin-binding protein 2
MKRPPITIFLLLGWAVAAGQEPRSSVQPAGEKTALASVDTVKPSAKPGGFAPTWDTQKQARTYVLNIPAPRGQIVDRNGTPLAQTRVSYNLAINFPTPLTFTDSQLLQYAEQQILLARAITGRPISLSQDLIFKHYKNRGVLPLVIAQDLKAEEIEQYNRRRPDTLTVLPTYQRYYPNAGLAGHIIGYAGRTGRMPDGPIQNNEVLWPGAEGREGLEQTFDDQLQGKDGQYNFTFDPSGKKTSEQVVIPPQPGYNVVTTLDIELQRLCEQTLEKSVKRGAIVIIDPNNGDILAMASWPTIDPNWFIPNISAEAFKALQDDPQIPLLPRAFRSAYPPGSTFKVAVGIAAMQEHVIEPENEFSCPPSMDIGRITFRNWKKTDAGSLNFADALTQSCDTWFYQVGIKTGSRKMADWALKLGFGARTGIPLAAEAEGRVPNDVFMEKTHQRKMLSGDLANFSIGQGDVLSTPLQLAQSMGIVGNGGTFYQTRLVRQVQSIDGQIVTAYGVRARTELGIEPKIMKEVRRGLVQVVSGSMGTAGKASVPNVKVAGKTGTAQWGPKSKERTAAWFAGYAPADKPKYAFAAVYESDASNSDDVHGGSHAAPLIGKVLREVFKDEAKEKKGKKKKVDEPADVEVRRAEPVEPVEPKQEPAKD